jgi:hypothetical protein
MNDSPEAFRRAALTALLAAAALFATIPTARAEDPAPTEADVRAAERCAAETRAAGRAFADVRDNVRNEGGARAGELLTAAEDALLDARSACRGNAEISASLEELAGEAESLRRSLSGNPR